MWMSTIHDAFVNLYEHLLNVAQPSQYAQGSDEI
jgi:hypothetical protein